MKIAIMQPYIFPYIGYFQLISSIDKFIFYDDVNFIKKGWINRNKILLNGESHVFTIPLKEISQNKLINETEIDWSSNIWQKIMLSIEHAYKKAPCYDNVLPLIAEVFSSKKQYISELAAYSITVIASYLNLEKDFKFSSRQEYNNKNLERGSRLIDICLKENSFEYINAIGGEILYSKNIFKEKGISLKFLKPILIPYKQYQNSFVQALSMIDVLMFNSKENTKTLINEFELL